VLGAESARRVGVARERDLRWGRSLCDMEVGLGSVTCVGGGVCATATQNN